MSHLRAPSRRLLATMASTLALASGFTSAGGRSVESMRIEVGDLVFDALAAGPEDGELVLLLHGFPQTSHSFRGQISLLAAAGYRAVAPDQRGYSPGARPQEVSAYGIPSLIGDVVGISEALGHDKFHVIGHDWGAAVAWSVSAYRPDKVLSLVALSTPHPQAFMQAFADPAGDQARRSSYMARFAADDAEQFFLADDAAFLRGLFQGGHVPSDDIEVYVEALGTREALRGALNWYRALLSSNVSGPGDASSSQGPATSAPSPQPIGAPTLYVFGGDDPVFSRAAADASASFVEGPYRYEVLEGVGHWVAEQATDRLNELLEAHFESLGNTGR